MLSSMLGWEMKLVQVEKYCILFGSDLWFDLFNEK